MHHLAIASRRLSTILLDHFGEGIAGDVAVASHLDDFQKPSETSSHKFASLPDKQGIHLIASEIAFDCDASECIVLDELSQHRIATQVTLGAGVQHLGIEFANDETQVKIAVDDRRDIFAADLTPISLIALCHDLDHLPTSTTRGTVVRRRNRRTPARYMDDNPNTSNMLYWPGDLSCSHFAAASAPDA